MPLATEPDSKLITHYFTSHIEFIDTRDKDLIEIIFLSSASFIRFHHHHRRHHHSICTTLNILLLSRPILFGMIMLFHWISWKKMKKIFIYMRHVHARLFVCQCQNYKVLIFRSFEENWNKMNETGNKTKETRQHTQIADWMWHVTLFYNIIMFNWINACLYGTVWKQNTVIIVIFITTTFNDNRVDKRCTMCVCLCTVQYNFH